MRKPLAAIILFYPQSKLYLENSICVISQMRKTKHSVVLRPLPKIAHVHKESGFESRQEV